MPLGTGLTPALVGLASRAADLIGVSAHARMRAESKEKELEAAGGCTGGSLADKVCNLADMAAPDGSYADMDTGGGLLERWEDWKRARWVGVDHDELATGILRNAPRRRLARRRRMTGVTGTATGPGGRAVTGSGHRTGWRRVIGTKSLAQRAIWQAANGEGRARAGAGWIGQRQAGPRAGASQAGGHGGRGRAARKGRSMAARGTGPVGSGAIEIGGGSGPGWARGRVGGGVVWHGRTCGRHDSQRCRRQCRSVARSSFGRASIRHGGQRRLSNAGRALALAAFDDVVSLAGRWHMGAEGPGGARPQAGRRQSLSPWVLWAWGAARSFCEREWARPVGRDDYRARLGAWGTAANQRGGRPGRQVSSLRADGQRSASRRRPRQSAGGPLEAAALVASSPRCYGPRPAAAPAWTTAAPATSQGALLRCTTRQAPVDPDVSLPVRPCATLCVGVCE
ncbi:hypothetical protein J3E71DRAFT_399955 [Bipolaris maydis]|nr:hypothetical protein J3E71DRAFT_399955 [Bipolaris maydis]